MPQQQRWPTTRVGRVALPVAVAAIAVGTWALAVRLGPGTNVGGAELLRVSVEGGRVTDDTQLHAALDGNHLVSDDLIATAFCNNGPDWDLNVTLDLNIAVATDPTLIRAAELIVSGEFDLEIIRRVEEHVIRADQSRVELQHWVETWDTGPASRYVAARSQPPSLPATDRFVVYVANRTTTEQVLVFADADRLDRDRVKGFVGALGLGAAGTADVVIAGDSSPRTLNAKKVCPSLFDAEESWAVWWWPVATVVLLGVGGFMILRSARRSN